MTLHELIQAFTIGRKIHISIHDLTGILQQPDLQIPAKHIIHACPFCDKAKMTPSGYLLCVSHKKKVNALAIQKQRAFWGYCPYGLMEIAYPVVLKGKVICIIYLGNLCPDPQSFRDRLQKTCRLTEVDTAQLLPLEKDCERAAAADYLCVAQILAEYILQQAGKPYPIKSHLHWAIEQVLTHVAHDLENDLNINELAALYGMNPKYLGRLFKQQMGMSFTEYVHTLRMERAGLLLENSNETITAIALSCGYSEITYFNRIFRKTYGCAPTQYRKSKPTEPVH